jgi:hypothetical protein
MEYLDTDDLSTNKENKAENNTIEQQAIMATNWDEGREKRDEGEFNKRVGIALFVVAVISATIFFSTNLDKTYKIGLGIFAIISFTDSFHLFTKAYSYTGYYFRNPNLPKMILAADNGISVLLSGFDAEIWFGLLGRLALLGVISYIAKSTGDQILVLILYISYFSIFIYIYLIFLKVGFKLSFSL